MKGRITKLGAIALATAIGFATIATLVQAQTRSPSAGRP